MKNIRSFVWVASAVCMILAAGLFVNATAQGKGKGNGNSNGKGHGPKSADVRPANQGTDPYDNHGRPDNDKRSKPKDDDSTGVITAPVDPGNQNGRPTVGTYPGNGSPNVGNPGNAQNNGVRDHGQGVGRGKGQGKGQGWWRRDLKGQNSQVKSGKQNAPVINPTVTMPQQHPAGPPAGKQKHGTSGTKAQNKPDVPVKTSTDDQQPPKDKQGRKVPKTT